MPMDDGVVRVNFVLGKPDSIQVGTGLEQTYERLFRSARRHARSRQSRESGVKVVLFGCFWLEALCNGCLRQILERSALPAGVQAAIAHCIERTRISAKLQILSSYKEPNQVDLLKRANRLFELRNRLVHFREELEDVPGPVVIETIERNVFGRLQETGLVKQLKPPALDAAIKDILLTKSWIDQVIVVKRVRNPRHKKASPDAVPTKAAR